MEREMTDHPSTFKISPSCCVLLVFVVANFGVRAKPDFRSRPRAKAPRRQARVGTGGSVWAKLPGLVLPNLFAPLRLCARPSGLLRRSG